MFRLAIAFLVLVLGACADETVSGFASPGTVYRLEQINGDRFAPRATLTFPKKGQIAGRAPCNSYSGTLTAVHPWFQAAPLPIAQADCPRIADEKEFLRALEAARFVEFDWPKLTLSNQRGLEMVFRVE